MVVERRLKHAALAIAVLSVIAVAGLRRPGFSAPSPASLSPADPAESPEVAARIPRLHAIPRPPGAPTTVRDAFLAQHEWTAALPGWAAADLDDGAGAPAADNGRLAENRGARRDDATDRPVSTLMVCHPDARGPLGAADVLQECINRAPAYSSIEIPPGTYVLYRRVIVPTPLTIRTAGSGGTSLSCAGGAADCAVFVAGPELLDMWGPLVVWSTNNVTLEHLVIDGNRGARVGSVAAQFCLRGGNAFGFNVTVLDCLDCTARDIVSRNALCGTGMVWTGARATIENSAFVSNGSAATPGLWADGLTAVYAPGSTIRGNQFIDNSDVALILGYGVASRVERNTIVQRAQPSFAGLMLHNFNSNDLSGGGDFRGAVITGNTIDCGRQLCVFGIQIGPRPWSPSRMIVGGEVHGNTVLGAKVGINVDGAGILAAPVVIYANTVSDVPSGSFFSACAPLIPTAWMNISPTAVVDRRDERTRAEAHLSDLCELSSALSVDD